ncbi:zinc finger CCCH-type with G patch domain-containing protein [Elysia marginata]|uniref:Zinc finger CCCH-type with G patch domain-containing protein n=1 Tax=Elysia marginata TaxID=1093978 RepID=A0AAV4I452_9GAST|nr:zinc finger CCCH-type with G patch domain-containing protein [Elysia marginata]
MSASNEEADQEASLAVYKEQLSQVEQALQLSGESTDLLQLRNDLKELINLTEENLLQLKKARLLKSLEESAEQIQDGPRLPSEKKNDLSVAQDDEYAAFQASISEVSSPQDTYSNHQLSPSPSLSKPSLQTTPGLNKNNNQYVDHDDNGDSSTSDDDDDVDDDFDTSLSHLIGTKCQAPIKNDWGGHHYGNAMIWSIDAVSEMSHSSEFMVRVIFLNPTQPSMVPCNYYMNDSCRFSEESCRRSHGQAVLVSELRPYQEPDHSKICEGCRCLAKSTDEVWYPAMVVDICDDHQVNVKFDSGGREMTVLVEHVKPITDEDENDDSDDDDEDADASISSLDTSHTKEHESKKKNKDDDEEDSDDGLPVYLWRPSQTTEKLGAWEAHTKGVGSRLMAKMGYIHGQGLGRSGEGRAEPVPIMLLPQGKSLDKIMELKELAGNADLFNAMKKMEKRQKAYNRLRLGVQFIAVYLLTYTIFPSTDDVQSKPVSIACRCN